MIFACGCVIISDRFRIETVGDFVLSVILSGRIRIPGLFRLSLREEKKNEKKV